MNKDTSMKFKNAETESYLMKFGWTSDRKVTLPAYIDISSTPEIVLSILANLYGIEFIDPDGYERTFLVHEAYIKDFESDMQEWKDDTGLNLKFFPLGSMAECGGILVLDQLGRFYLAGDELIYYGDSFEEFIDVTFYGRLCGISIRDNATTFFTYNDKDTDFSFDENKGWLETPEHRPRE